MVDLNAVITAIVTNGIGAVCAGAVLWFAWYRETKTIPAMLDTFAKAQKDLMVSFENLAREERTNYQKWHEENRTRLDKLFLEQREQRHYLRDLANQIGVRQALEDERRKRSTGQEEHEP